MKQQMKASAYHLKPLEIGEIIWEKLMHRKIIVMNTNILFKSWAISL